MEIQKEWKQKIPLEMSPECANTEIAQRLREKFGAVGVAEAGELSLRLDSTGVSLVSEGQILQGDFTRMLPRLKNGRLQGEMLVRAAKIKGTDGPLTALDATAGLGEDSLLLAAAGFHVILYERNPVIYELLRDAVARAMSHPELADTVTRMDVRFGDSVEAMARLESSPDVILLDPMFPERQKSALVKKKLQMIQKLEEPCVDERKLLLTAMGAKPRKLIVKRPSKGPYLADIKPDYSLPGKAVRYDCFITPYDKLHKLIP